MARITFRSFTGGEVSASLAARYDLQKAGTFLQLCENMVVNTIGDIERRPGTLFMEDFGEDEAFLLPFSFNSEASENYILIFQADKILVRRISIGEDDTEDLSAEISYDSATPYSLDDLPRIAYAQVGDVLYLAHRDYPLQKITRSGTYPDYTWAIEEVTLNQSIAAPEASGISVRRGYEYYTCGSTRCCYEYCLNETSRLGYKVSAVDSDGVESTASNECQITFRYPTDWIVGDLVTFCWTWSDTNGSGSSPEYYNVYRDSAGYYGFIGTTCGNVYCFVDQNFEPDTSMTPKEDWDPFADNNHPGTVTFHQQRMWLGGTRNEPTTVYASRTSDFESFRKSRPLQDDDPIEYRMATGSIDDVMWLKSFGNLFVGTTGGEFTASSSGAALTPEDVQINLQSSWGSRGVMPLLVGNAILHVRRNGSRVIELAYNWENDSYSGNDLTLLAPHMVEDSPIRQWCFTQSPEPRIWAVREDGVLICCTYNREQNIYGWSRHVTEGKFVSIISLCGEKGDEIVLLVKREIRGQEYYFLERFAPRFDDNTAIEDAFFVDCGVILDNSQGESELESSSLAHLVGKTVSVLNVGSPEIGHGVTDPDAPEPGPDASEPEPEPEPGEPNEPDDDDVIITPPEDDGDGDGEGDDGSLGGDFTAETPEEPTDSKGRLTLQYGVPGKVIVGLPFTSVMAPLPIDSENDSGSSVGLRRALGKTSIRVHRSVDFEYAATKSGWLVDRSAYKEAEFFEAPFLPENYGEPVPPFSGTVEVIVPSGQEEDSSLYIKTDKPTPLRVLSITADIDFGETR